MPRNDHAATINAERVEGQTQRILSDMSSRQIPPLEVLAIMLYVFENMAEGMLEQSAHGKFVSNREGILKPVEAMYTRLRNKQPPAGYLET